MPSPIRYRDPGWDPLGCVITLVAVGTLLVVVGLVLNGAFDGS